MSIAFGHILATYATLGCTAMDRMELAPGGGAPE